MCVWANRGRVWRLGEDSIQWAVSGKLLACQAVEQLLLCLLSSALVRRTGYIPEAPAKDQGSSSVLVAVQIHSKRQLLPWRAAVDRHHQQEAGLHRGTLGAQGKI